MSVKTEHYPLKISLNLRVRDTQYPLTVHAISVSVTKQNQELIECHLTFCINPALYQQIDKEALFNLTPDVRTPISAVEFLPEPDIAIETRLKQDFLPHLAEYATNIDEVATYLLSWMALRKALMYAE